MRILLALSLLLLIALPIETPAADRSLRLAPGARATVELEENPSTGYKWQLDRAGSSNLAIVRITDRGFSGGGGKRLGAPGVHRWTVEGLKPGSARILFVYQRSWERTPVRRHEVAVEVARR
jgi:inhibitor of cysteine peptidase